MAKQSTKEELENELATLKNRLQANPGMSDYAATWLKHRIQFTMDKLNRLYPPPLPAVSVKLREWRGQRGLRVAVPLLSEAIGAEISISTFARIESGKLGNVDETVLADIEAFLKSQ